MDKLLASLSKFNRREQTILLVGALAVGLYLIWLAILAPLQKTRESLLLTNTATEQSLGRVRLLARQIEVQSQQASHSGGGSENVIGTIDASLRSNGLTMGSLVPGAGGEVRVGITKANSDAVMQWLYDLEIKEHLAIRDLNLTTSTEPGQVAVSVRLVKP